jgi:hypothetical protein
MPKMPESEKKEESAESREEAKEQVSVFFWFYVSHFNIHLLLVLPKYNSDTL